MRAKTILSILLCAVFLTGCNGLGGTPSTPQPASPEQISRDLVNQINDYLINFDPIGYAIDTKFQAVDARYNVGGNNQLNALELFIDCQGGCSKERTISVLIMALKAKYPSVPAAFPDTLKDLIVYTMEHMKATSVVEVKWKEVSDYIKNNISGAQLASRLKFLNP